MFKRYCDVCNVVVSKNTVPDLHRVSIVDDTTHNNSMTMYLCSVCNDAILHLIHAAAFKIMESRRNEIKIKKLYL